MQNKIRCDWALSSESMTAYHDSEWGVPVHDDRLLFEMLNLEGAQAGLSWQTILSRRDNYRIAFDNFNAKRIANYGDTERKSLLLNAGIIRNRLKINAVIENSRALLAIQQKYGSFDTYLWKLVDNSPLVLPDKEMATQLSKEVSNDLKKHGFRFAGPTTCYAFMQSVGMVNDHTPECFCYGR